MKALVTGGAGFIGSHLVDRLLLDGHEVVVIDNLYRGKRQNLQNHLDHGQITFYQADIRNFDQLSEICRGCEVIFHLAAQSNVLGAVQDLDYSFFTNVGGVFNMLKAAQVAGARRFIFTSSREAYGEAQYLPVDENHPLASKNTYGASKVAGEKYCQVFQNMGKMEVAILRLANVYGTRDYGRVIPIFLDNVLHHQDIVIYGGQQLIDFVPVSLVVEALIRSIDNVQALSDPTNVASGKGITLFELANRIMEIAKTNSRIIIEAPRTVEVVKFTADIRRFNQVFGIRIPDDPLCDLDKMVES